MDAACAQEAHALLTKLSAVDADVHFRSLVVRCKCEELERTLRYVQQLHVHRAKVRDARRDDANHQETLHQQMHDSIQDAIQRARKVRESMAAKSAVRGGADTGASGNDDDRTSSDGDHEEEATGSSSPNLHRILAMAKSIRANTPIATHKNAAAATSSNPADVSPPPSNAATAGGEPGETNIRLEYPRRMKLLLDQLRDLQDRERHESFRFVFCRKLSERLSVTSPVRSSDSSERETVFAPRVQVSFPKQVARLQQGYKHIGAFMSQKVDPASEKFQRALQSPALSAIFPLYTRVKQTKKMLKLLDEEAKALVERAPAPPTLSPAAIAHRDAMLKRIGKRPTESPSTPGAVDSHKLITSIRGSAIDEHRSTIERLQAAWDASREDTAASSTHAVFEATLKEIILTDTSNTILTFFKKIFCETPDDPDPIHVKSMLLLIRLVDSISMSNGRRLRSAVSA